MVEIKSSSAMMNNSDSDLQISSIDSRPKSERGKELWDILKSSVKLTSDVVKKLDEKPAIVRHGIHHFRKIHHDEDIIDVIYNSITKEYVTVDNQFVRIFHKDGRRKDIVDLGCQIVKLSFCEKSGHYVALVPPQELRLYNNDFEMVSIAKSPQKVDCMSYNPNMNELVTAGPGYVRTWCFRYGNRYLVPHHTITENLTCKDCFDKLALEKTESNKQRCFAVCGTSVAVFSLFQAKLLVYKRDLHVRNITSILFFNPLKYVVTGSRDGSIKVWDEFFNILLVFVGHNGAVTSLNLYPQGPYIMSASNDASIRVWSLETRDEVDLIVMEDPVLNLGTTAQESQLFSFSKYTVDLWTITHVHQIFSSVGSSVKQMNMTSHRQLIDRVLCQTEEGIIHLVSPVDGTVVASLAPPDDHMSKESVHPPNDSPPSTPPKQKSSSTLQFSRSHRRRLLDAIYSLSLETVVALYDNDCLVKAMTTVNPAKIKRIWNYDKDKGLTCMCLYEYIINSTQLQTTWNDVKSGLKVTRQYLKTPRYGNKTVLFAGREDGSIVQIDWFNGEVLFTSEGHTPKSIIALTPNVAADQIVSAGKDNVVKVWRVFPNTNHPLALLMSFYCAQLPVNLAISGSRLAVAFQQPSTATYTIVMYDLKSKERFDHTPDYDHTDDFMGLACCRRLKLFASASRDGTIRIWNTDNTLVRIIKVNDDPKSIEFCNQKGDILVGFGRNIHIIRHDDYLPKVNIYKMFCMEFPIQEKEDRLPLDENALKVLRPDAARKIKNARSSYLTVVHDWDPRTEEEEEKLVVSRKNKLEMFEYFAARDKELLQIKDGDLAPKRLDRKPSKRSQNRAFQKYLDLFYDRPSKIRIPKEDDFNPDPPQERKPTPEVFIKESKIGFFPPIKTAKPMKELLEKGLEKEEHYKESGPNYETKQKYIIPPSGFIPNSILIKLLWPQDEVKKLEEDLYKPPVLTGDQLDMLQHMDKVSAEQPMDSPGYAQGDADRILMMESDEDWDDQERVFNYDDHGEDVIDPSAGKMTTKGNKVEKKPSFLDQMKNAMKTPSPPPKEPTPPPTPPPPAEPKIKLPTKPSKPLVRFVSRPPPPKVPTPVPPTPPPKTPTPPPPPPPPRYLTQFIGQPWFDRHKDYMMQRMNDPFTALHFFNILCDLLAISIDWDHRTGMVEALLLLWQQESLTSTRHVIPALTSILSASVAPSPKEPSQLLFLHSSMKLYQTLSPGSEELVIELLTQFLESDSSHRLFIQRVLIEQGLMDPHKYLAKELESWELWQLDESKPIKSQLREMAEKWFKDWSLRFKNHVEDTLERLKKGDVKAKVRRSGLSKTAESGKRVHFEIANMDSSKSGKPIEILNYFCEMKLEEELERDRLANLQPEPTKNTVLVLPKLEGKQAIVRLGEMHTARRVRNRQQLASEFKLNALMGAYPDLLSPFSRKLSLPTGRCYINPFPSEIDRFDKWTDEYQPILLTLKSPAHQKYFIPERSYVHS